MDDQAARCVDCTAPSAPGSTRCTRCHAARYRYVPEQQAIAGDRANWVLRDAITRGLVADYDGTVERWATRDAAEAFAAGLRELDSLKPS